jgi:hypothetical protein
MSNLAAWRAQRRTTLTLPSGLEVDVRRVTAEDVASQSGLPTPLVAQVLALTNRPDALASPTDAAERFIASATAINIVVTAALVSPAIGAVEDDDHILLDEIPFVDKIAIFEWAQGGAAALAPFPGVPAGAGEGAAPRGNDLPRAAKRAATGLVG